MISPMARLLGRHLASAAAAALADTRVVAINGARQAGKSTLVHELMKGRGGEERTLDDATILAAARADPNRFVRHDGLLALDEVQRVPELMLAIKAVVDRSTTPGQFLLTGSARLLGLRRLPDALVGRMETLELWPFSQGEIEQRRESFIDAVFADEIRVSATSDESREGYVERISRGGFPEAVRRDEGRRARFFSAYGGDLVDRDVSQLADIQRRDALHQLLKVMAGRAGQLLKNERLASDAGIPATTLERYLSLFEEVFLIKRVLPWSASTTDRAVRMRKLLFVDSGLCAHLQGRTIKRLLRDDAALGPLLENFVLGELARQLGWAATRTTLHHYRTRDGIEVDAVLESADGRIVGIEVKSAETVRAEDFSGLRHLQARVPDRFHHGLVLYTGGKTLPFGERLLAAPIDALWRTEISAPRARR
jgi:predicted AAA+ superfamily ATPase